MWDLGSMNLAMNLLTVLSGMMGNLPDVMEPDVNEVVKDFADLGETLDPRVVAARDGRFPNDFLFGVATAAYATEGAWNVSGKGESTWDRFTHSSSGLIPDGSNGDVAANSYFMYKTDIELASQLSANTFKISLSWSRILPTGYSNNINKKAIKHYNRVIDAMIAKGIVPHVTLYYFDLPQPLHEIGGWANPLMINHFAEYAAIAFAAFGDRVKIWTTIHDPTSVCLSTAFQLSPSRDTGGSEYMCGHNILLAHARAYRIYDQLFRPEQKGRVGFDMVLDWPVLEGSLSSRLDEETERWFRFHNDWMLNPIFSSDGDYPPEMKVRVAELSITQGYPQSRLPEFSDQQIETIKQSADFLDVNFHAAQPIKRSQTTVSYYGDIGLELSDSHQHTAAFSDRSTPWAFVALMQRLNNNFVIPMFTVTLNGYYDRGQLADIGRAKYFHEHLTEIPKLIAEGIDIQAFYAWSLVDGFDWFNGYSRHYGLFFVDFNDPHRTRIPKTSTKVIGDIYKEKSVPQFLWSLNDIEFDVDIGDKST